MPMSTALVPVVVALDGGLDSLSDSHVCLEPLRPPVRRLVFLSRENGDCSVLVMGRPCWCRPGSISWRFLRWKSVK